MNFNEWLTANKKEYAGLSTSKDLGMETADDADLLENQVDQWITKLIGLLNNASAERKQKLAEKIVTELKKRI
jgi:hypothetical protein